MASNEERKEVTDGQVRLFQKTDEQLDTFYKEIGLISRKKPSEVLNKFKLGFINQTIAKANELLGEEFRPYSDFTLFDVEGSMPTASDVAMMLAHYQKAMESFQLAHSTMRKWHIQDTEHETSDEDDEEEENDEEFEDDDNEGGTET